MTTATDSVTALADMMKYMGSTATYTRTKPPLVIQPVKVLLSHPSYKDEEIVNAYGVDVTILTFQHVDPFTTLPPEKFDSVTILGKRYVFDFVHPVVILDTIIGWTCYSKGKGA